MLKKLIDWILRLFGIKKEEPTFSGWVQDEVDPRDQVYGGGPSTRNNEINEVQQ